jgi:hypothetical protein
MRQDDDPVFTHPEWYGIEDPDAPGEPDRADMPPVSPIPGTGRQARERHQREHDVQGRTPHDLEFWERREREAREQARSDLENDSDTTGTPSTR